MVPVVSEVGAVFINWPGTAATAAPHHSQGVSRLMSANICLELLYTSSFIQVNSKERLKLVPVFHLDCWVLELADSGWWLEQVKDRKMRINICPYKSHSPLW